MFSSTSRTALNVLLVSLYFFSCLFIFMSIWHGGSHSPQQAFKSQKCWILTWYRRIIWLWWICFLSKCFAIFKKKGIMTFSYCGCCPFLFVTSQYQLHADTTRASWAALLLWILLWFQKCRVCVCSALNLPLHMSYCCLWVCVRTLILCMSSTVWKQWDKIWNHREKLFCIQRPGFPGAVLFPQYLAPVRISKGGHHPAVLSSCMYSLTLWILFSWKPGCQLLVWDFLKILRVRLSLPSYNLSFLEMLSVSCGKTEKQHADVGSGMFSVSGK